MSINLKKQDWKPGLIMWGLFSVFIIIGFLIAAFDHSYPVTHTAAVAHPGYESFPEMYYVQISASQAFAKSWTFWRVLGIIAWLGLGLFLVLEDNDAIGIKEGTFGTFLARNPIKVVVVLLAIAMFGIFAKHSNVQGTVKPLTAQEYKAVEGSDSALHALFE
jgi:hypothetical protein